MKRAYKIYLLAPALCFFLTPFSLAQDGELESFSDTDPSNSFLLRGGMTTNSQGRNVLIAGMYSWPVGDRFSIGLGAGYERFPDNNFVPVFIDWRTNLGGVFDSQLRPFISVGAGLAVNFKGDDKISQVNGDFLTDFAISSQPLNEHIKSSSNQRVTGRFHVGLGISRAIAQDLSLQLKISGRLHRMAFPYLNSRSVYPGLNLPSGTDPKANMRRPEDWEKSLILTLGMEFR